MHLRVFVLLALPTLMLSQSQEETAPPTGTTPQEAVQQRMAAAEIPTASGFWARCGSASSRQATDTQRQERRVPEQTQQRAVETDSYQSERQASYGADPHHSEEQAPYHANYGALPYQGNLPGFGYMSPPRRSYYEGAAMNYPYQHSASQYHYAVPNY